MSPGALLILFWAAIVLSSAVIHWFSGNVRTLLAKRDSPPPSSPSLDADSGEINDHNSSKTR